jgi:copper(I)-binding protein
MRNSRNRADRLLLPDLCSDQSPATGSPLRAVTIEITMNRIVSGALALFLLASPTAISAQDHGAHAHPIIVGALEISGAFSRATLPNAPVGAGYLTITNTGAVDDTLVSASSPVAAKTQIHQMKLEGDVMKMSEVEGGLDIPAGETVALTPGGRHIMFMDLTQALAEGSSVPLTLTFEKAGSVEVELAVGPINADAPSHDMHDMEGM